VRDLLTFTAGLGQVFGDLPIVRALDAAAIGNGPPNPGGVPAADEWLARIGALPLLHQPGDGWGYHTAADVLGVLLARAAGMPLPELLHERVFAPLGMRDTAFHVPSDAQHRFATAYAPEAEPGSFRAFDPPDGQWSTPPEFASGGGGLVSTVDDYATFARMLLAGGVGPNGRILSRPTVELMTTDQLTPEQKARTTFVPDYFVANGWGFCCSVTTRRVYASEPVGSYGWDGGLGSSWRNAPSEGVITILLSQRAWTSAMPPALSRDFASAVYAAID
jgi:CubicO group peptidase (beta-lactamase class C family)